MDHCHKTGVFRNILCNNCNVNDNCKNTSGTPNIFHCIKKNLWRYKRIVNGKSYEKYFKSYYEAIIYKWLFEAGHTIEF